MRDKAEENQVLGDALEATRRALAKSEREGAKLKEGLNTVLAGGDKDDKMTLIESLFEKLDGMATRYSSVISTPTIQIPQSPQAGDVGEMSALRRELDDMSNELQRASASSGDSDKLRKQLKAAQDAKIAALADAEAFQTERDDAIAEVERLRQALKTTSAGGGGEPFLNNERMRELEGLLVEAQNAIGLLSDDNESLLVKLRRYEEAGSGSDGSDSKHVRAAQQAARDAATAANEVAQEAEQAILAAYSRNGSNAELQQELDTQRELAARRADEVEKLKSIIGDIDAQREGLSQKLRVAYASLREVESKKDSSGQFEGSTAEKIMALENECMRLQDEADAAAEALEEARERAMREGAAAEAARRLGATAEAKVYSAVQARDAALARVRTLEESIQHAVDKEKHIAMETAQYRQELAVVSDDLMAMTKEQQVVNAELLRATSERDNAWSELREAKAAQQAAEANAKAKQKEVDDVVNAYQELGVENRRVVADMDDMERDLRRAKVALDSSEATLAQATERAKAAEAENKAYASDLQAYQRQVDNLTHLLENSVRDKGDDTGSYEALTTKLEASKAMLFDMERAREMSRRETAAAEANLLVTRSRLTDAQGDNETLKHKLRLETNRVRELESLVSALRTHEHQAVVESGDSSQRSELLRERVSALQEQNHGLSRQLEALKQDKKSFETEVERLRNLIEDAAAGGSTTSQSGRTVTSALVHAEAQAKEREHEVERLTALLQQAQEKCATLENSVREAESTANDAKREALAIARREAEARAELGGLRSELSIAKDALRDAMEDGYSNNDSQVLQMRVTDAERRAAAAESALSSMERANPVSAASAEEVKVLREENQRLLHLLSKANDDLSSARKIIDEQGYADGATALLVNERVQAAEEARRRVEQDFQRLVEQMQQMESGAGGELLDRLRELEEVNTELEYENDALRESLAGTEEAIAVMQQDLARTVDEYAKLGSLVETISDDSDA